MKLRSFRGREVVVDHDDLDLGTVWQVGRLVDHDSAILDLHLERLHGASLPLPTSRVFAMVLLRPRGHRVRHERTASYSGVTAPPLYYLVKSLALDEPRVRDRRQHPA